MFYIKVRHVAPPSMKEIQFKIARLCRDKYDDCFCWSWDEKKIKPINIFKIYIIKCIVNFINYFLFKYSSNMRMLILVQYIIENYFLNFLKSILIILC